MGLVTLALDPAGSRGCPPGSSPPAAALRKDAYAALNYLRSINVVGSQKIFVEGISRGGGVVLAALDNNQNSDQQQRFAGGIAYVPWCYPTPTPYAPLVIFSGGDDWISSAKQCEQLRGRGNLEVVVFPDAAHEFAVSDGADARTAQARADAFILSIWRQAAHCRRSVNELASAPADARGSNGHRRAFLPGPNTSAGTARVKVAGFSSRSRYLLGTHQILRVMRTSFAIVFIFRAVPHFAAGSFNFERAIPAP
jgi:hypothetical protein